MEIFLRQFFAEILMTWLAAMCTNLWRKCNFEFLRCFSEGKISNVPFGFPTFPIFSYLPLLFSSAPTYTAIFFLSCKKIYRILLKSFFEFSSNFVVFLAFFGIPFPIVKVFFAGLFLTLTIPSALFVAFSPKKSISHSVKFKSAYSHYRQLQNVKESHYKRKSDTKEILFRESHVISSGLSHKQFSCSSYFKRWPIYNIYTKIWNEVQTNNRLYFLHR